MKYTQIPTDTFQKLQMNAGILVSGFTPATGEISQLLGATTGGINFNDTPSYTDFGDDVDNCPKNTKELKHLDSREITMSGTFVTISADMAKSLMGAADEDESNANHIIPRNTLEQSDFTDLWWVGDYSDVNTGENAGYLAIHLMNALNTNGFQIQSSDKAKGQFSFNFMGHYSIDAQDTVPYEVYIKEGESTATPSIFLSSHYESVAADDTVTLTATVVPSGTTITWSSASDAVATVSDGVVTAVAAGNTVITASITVNGVTVTDTCTIVVTE